MSYRAFNWLFGWDYVQWWNVCDSGIARVHVDGTGRVFYWRYKNIAVADVIRKPDQVLWLTCSPDKYLKAEFAQGVKP